MPIQSYCTISLLIVGRPQSYTDKSVFAVSSYKLPISPCDSCRGKEETEREREMDQITNDCERNRNHHVQCC